MAADEILERVESHNARALRRLRFKEHLPMANREHGRARAPRWERPLPLHQKPTKQFWGGKALRACRWASCRWACSDSPARRRPSRLHLAAHLVGGGNEGIPHILLICDRDVVGSARAMVLRSRSSVHRTSDRAAKTRGTTTSYILVPTRAKTIRSVTLYYADTQYINYNYAHGTAIYYYFYLKRRSIDN